MKTNNIKIERKLFEERQTILKKIVHEECDLIQEIVKSTMDDDDILHNITECLKRRSILGKF